MLGNNLPGGDLERCKQGRGPDQIGFAQAAGLPGDVRFDFKLPTGFPYTAISSLNPQLVLRPFSRYGAFGYDIVVDDVTGASGLATIPGSVMNDRSAWKPQRPGPAVGHARQRPLTRPSGRRRRIVVISTVMAKQQRPLTQKQETFVRKVAEGMPASRAYRDAGFAASSVEKGNFFRFTSGAKLYCGYLEREADAANYQGWTLTRLYFDELTQLTTLDPVLRLLATLSNFEHDGCTIPRGALVVYREWYGASAPNVGLWKLLPGASARPGTRPEKVGGAFSRGRRARLARRINRPVLHGDKLRIFRQL
jgi:hypothetical protein